MPQPPWKNNQTKSKFLDSFSLRVNLNVNEQRSGAFPGGVGVAKMFWLMFQFMGSWYGGKGIQSDGCYRIVLQIQDL